MNRTVMLSLSLCGLLACSETTAPDVDVDVEVDDTDPTEPTTDEADCVPSDERCDGVDNDCDGEIDEEAVDAATFFADLDEDGFGDDASTVEACQAPVGFVEVGGDCDDTLANVNPNEVDVCDGVDNDCDPTTGLASLFDETSVVDLTDRFDGTASNPAELVLDTPGTLALCVGTVFAHLDIQADVRIEGGLGPAPTVIDGGGQPGAVLTYATAGVTAGLKGLTIQNGIGDDTATCKAGGICLTAGSVILLGEDLVLRDHVGPGEGGALAMLGGTVTFVDTELANNRADRGGAVHVRPDGRFSLTDGTLSFNTATRGGALFMLGGASVTVLDNVDVEGNHSTEDGGAILIDNGDFTMRDSHLHGNSSDEEGGAIALVGAADRTLIEDSVIEGNSAEVGAALFMTRSAALASSDIFGNTATDPGSAAVDVAGGVLDIESCNFEDPVTGATNTPASISAGSDKLDPGSNVSGQCDASGCN